MPDIPPPQVPIAIVGVGALMPGSSDVGGFWRDILNGRDLITDVPSTHWLIEDYYDSDQTAPDKTYGRRGAFLSAVDFPLLKYGIPPNTLEATDTTQLLALLVAEQVLTDAVGGELNRLDRDRVSVMLGTGALELLYSMSNRLQRPVWLKALREHGVPEPDAQAICERIADHYVPWQEATFPGLLSNVVAGRIASKFDLHGTNHTTDAACASSLAAVSSAVNELALGKAELAIAGGVDTLNDIVMYLCFSKTPALSPSGDCRPFSNAADGTLLGEGLVMLALKRLDDAERDGDQVYAVLRGIGASSDGRSTAIYAPLPAGQAKAIRRAYESAGYGPDTVELVEAHGTGTKAGDHAEYTALRETFGGTGQEGGPWCALGSVKSQVGHTKSASGAAGMLKAVLALQHKVLPPTIKVDQPNAEIDFRTGPLYLNTVARPWVRDASRPRRASVSSFGFGGSNFHLTLEEYVPGDDSAARSAPRFRATPTELVPFCADSLEDLVAELDRATDEHGDLATIAHAAQQAFDAGRSYRLAVVAETAGDLAGKLRQATTFVRRDPQGAFSAPGGVHYASGPAAAGKTAFLFSGQGSQYIGMGADVTMHLPQAQAVWDRAAALPIGDRPLHQVVFPVPVFDDADRAAQQALLTQTEWAQPALAVQSLALLSVLAAAGVHPDAVAGHSLGELTALHAAGIFDADALVQLTRKRGELMRDAAATPGAMLAVVASGEEIEAALGEGGLDDLWMANLNGPKQTVLSGAGDAVEAAERTLTGAGLSAKRLSTATGFHSPLVAPASEPFLDFLRTIPFEPAQREVYGNTDAAVYPTDPEEARRRVADHLARPVRFADEIETMYCDGVRTFVEVGAGAGLSRLVGDILGEREHLALSLDAKGRHGLTSLQDALGRLAVQGIDVDFAALWTGYALPAAEPSAQTDERPQMTTTILGSNYGRPYPPPGGASELPPPNAEVTAPEHQAPPPAQPPVSPTAQPTPRSAAPAPAAESASAPGTAPASTAGPAAAQARAQAAQSPQVTALIEAQRQTAEAHARYQQQAAEAHATYQRLMSESHLAFLRVFESTYTDQTAVPVDAPAQSAVPATRALESAGPAPAQSAAPPAPGTTAPPAPEPASPPQENPAEPMVAEPRASMDLEGVLLGVVADKTGYPVDMLASDMDLEADLGVDSIKRIEILAASREEIPELVTLEASELGRLRTIRDIVGKLSEATGSAPGAGGVAAAEEPGGAVEPAPVPNGVLRHHAVRAVPAPASGLELAGLSGGPLVITDGGTGIASHVADGLKAHGLWATVGSEIPQDACGVIFLGGLREMSTPAEALAVHHEAFQAAKTLAQRLRGGDAGVFVTVQDTGGDFGTSGRAGVRAWSGGLAALTRTAAKEWPTASVKAIDCERAGRTPEAVAEAIVAELLTGADTLDVGLRADGERLTLQQIEIAAADGAAPRNAGPESVIVATGGARGVTAAALLALARAGQPRIALLGRSTLEGEPADLAQATDEATLKRALIERAHRESGGPAPAPAEIAAAAARILAGREVRANLAELEAAGSKIKYFAVDVRDNAAVTAALDEVRHEWGPVTGIVHGAGVLADKNIADKPDDQFDRVFGTKTGGLLAVLAATAQDPIDTLCLFSSVAARFGNTGQCDYAMANEVLNQVACAERADRPQCRISAIAWGPWQGGMVDPALQRHFRSHGVELILVADGADAFVRTFTSPAPDAQVIVAGEGVAEIFGGGAQPETAAAIRLTGEAHPQLVDHSINGTPVLPVAVALEYLTAAARAWQPAATGLRKVGVLHGITLDNLDGAGHAFVVQGQRAGAVDPLTLRLVGADGVPRYSAEAMAASAPGDWTAPADLQPFERAEIYDGHVLFQGARFHALLSVDGRSAAGAAGTLVGLRELGWDERRPWWTDPAMIDGGLQLAVLWAEQVLGAATLPMSVDEYRVHSSGPATGRIRCVVRAGDLRDDRAGCAIGFVDEDGSVRAELLGVSLIKRPS